ncbi:membrane protein [Bacillus phage Nachito]|nr:membrane protein [Bacillus phage Nachito]
MIRRIWTDYKVEMFFLIMLVSWISVGIISLLSYLWEVNYDIAAFTAFGIGWFSMGAGAVAIDYEWRK